MPQLDQLSTCPGCGEPLEKGDRYCGVCGAELPAGQGEVPPHPPRPVRTPTEPDFTLPPPQQAPPARRQASPVQPVQPPPVQPSAGPGPTAYPHPHPHPPQDQPQAPPAAASVVQPPQQPQAQSARADHPPQPSGRPASPDPRHGAAAEHGTAGPDPVRPADPRLRDTALPSAGAHPLPCAVCADGPVGTDGYCGSCGRAQPGDRDHVERSLEGVAGVSNLGLRHHRNEDAFTLSATALPDGTPAVIAVVCDGVSSSHRPHDASAAAAEAAGESLLAALARGVPGPQAMHDAVLDASRAVNALAGEEQVPGKNAPASTFAASVTAGGTLTVGWVGDSRAYWIPEDRTAAPARLTEDDSWAHQMVAAGLLTEAEAMADRRAHAITSWLGADNPDLEPHTASYQPDRPGVVLVCTDGLWNYAEAAEQMAALVPADARTAPLRCAQQLVRYALDSGGHDNVTVTVVPFPAADGRDARGGGPGARAAAGPPPTPTPTQTVPRPE
ncbi:protein phosphatase 2C domain-containing protein [Streptomyces sp. ACA25]|uniref:protein phosphatase 2C domain-containing protein n=1 Tax=Streptomyces sp. ACA25 TaxID=3022596 RepID=UPI00230793F1|nr:protein phosphatase 2C domain-containing protein [Streptomyces sp. ACA25]MDB1086747.1 protein phosphatase 2C domain-containing protein [Streptomyces sp. ACA25]